jgi:hypothetical protein
VSVKISEELVEKCILLVEYYKVSTENRKLKQALIERMFINNGRKKKRKSKKNTRKTKYI